MVERDGFNLRKGYFQTRDSTEAAYQISLTLLGFKRWSKMDQVISVSVRFPRVTILQQCQEDVEDCNEDEG
jgi:hypothetical protein